tara:strand:+ start:8949 stop:12398 length:3450 start_codon:yes stop_codon:yes gene_type:complete
MAIREKTIPYKVQIRGTSAEKKNLVGLQHEFDKARSALTRFNREQRKGGKETQQASATRLRLTQQMRAQRNALNDATRAQLQNNNALRQNSGFTAGISQGFKSFAASMVGPVAIIGGAVAIIGGLFRAVGNAANTIKDFEQKAANLGAVANLTGSDLAAMKTQAKQLGATTSFTASQVLELQTELAKLGFGKDEILNMTKSVLGLSAALGAELGETSAFVGANLRAFGKEATDAQEFVDVFAAAASNSSLDLSKMSTALAAVGPVAKASGQDIQATTSYLGLLTDRGLDASTAGTGLRNVFLELSNRGITMQEALQQIASSSDKTKASFDLFGKRGAVIGTILADTALETDGATSAFQKLERKMYEAGGTADRMARQQLNTLEGKSKLLSSAWDGFILSLDSGDGVISKTAKGITTLATSFLEMITPSEDITLALRAEQETLKRLGPALAESAAGTDERKDSIKDLQDQYPQLLQFIEEHHEGMDLETASQMDLAKVVTEFNGELSKKITLMIEEARVLELQTQREEDLASVIEHRLEADKLRAAGIPELTAAQNKELEQLNELIETVEFAMDSQDALSWADMFGGAIPDDINADLLSQLAELEEARIKLTDVALEEQQKVIDGVNNVTKAERERFELEQKIFKGARIAVKKIESDRLKALELAEEEEEKAEKRREKNEKKVEKEKARRLAEEKALRDSRIAIEDDEQKKAEAKAKAATDDKIAALRKADTLTSETKQNLEIDLKNKLAAIDVKFKEQAEDRRKKDSKDLVNNFKGSLIELNDLYAEGLILTEDYEEKRQELFKSSSEAQIENFDGDLTALKSLLDQKLITQQDYEAKRKEILDTAEREGQARQEAAAARAGQLAANLGASTANFIANSDSVADRQKADLAELQASYEKGLISYTDFTNGTTEVNEKANEDKKANNKAFLKDLILNLIDAAHAQVLASIVASSAQSLAQPDSVATFGATGGARIAILTGLIEAGFQVFKAGISAIFQDGGRPIDVRGGGLADGPRHSEGGIKFKSKATGNQQLEMEGGEFIINRRDTANNLRLLKYINSGGVVNSPFSPLRTFADGGQPAASQYIRPIVATADVNNTNSQSAEMAELIGEQVSVSMKDFAAKFQVVNVAQETDKVLTDAHKVDNRADLG